MKRPMNAGGRIHHTQGLASLFAPPLPPAPRLPRKRIWDLAGHFHCSIIGTCLTTAELRKLLTKLGLATSGESDHDLHGRAVSLASRQDMAAKLLNKAIDERHQPAIKRYAKAGSEAELRSLWREDVKAGDIPGSYWAVLTHPATTHELVREAFGCVHMLSHMVGAANRADICRLRRLEEENAALRETLERQQAHIRNTATARDATIRTLRRDLADRVTAPGMPPADAALADCIADLRRQLDAHTARRISAEDRLAQARVQLGEAEANARTREARLLAMQGELDDVEAALRADDAGVDPIDLAGATILYVGGRPAQIPHLRRAATRLGGEMLHHDGGVEDNDLLLASLLGRADIVVFPVDCVSHAAAGTVKRGCSNAGKRYVPLRSGAVTSFMAALSHLGRCEAAQAG